MTKVCIIGGAGFLGSHVADALTLAGHEVCIYDQKISPWLKDGQKMIVGDILNFEQLDAAIKGSQIVYNFAALADLNAALDRPLDTVRINVLGNAHVLEACRSNGVKRFIYASTVYVYSREGGFYRCSKQAAEHYVEEYQRIYGLDYTILRYGSLYGPRADQTNGLLRIVKDALKNKSISYEGNADSIREYIHVEDAANASIIALGDEFKNESVVLTGHEPMRVYDLLQMLAEIIGIPNSSILFKEEEYAGHYVRTPYAYQPKLGRKYTPPLHVDLGQGLLELIDVIEKDNGATQ